jgi:hypothetical protein
LASAIVLSVDDGDIEFISMLGEVVGARHSLKTEH